MTKEITRILDANNTTIAAMTPLSNEALVELSYITINNVVRIRQAIEDATPVVTTIVSNLEALHADQVKSEEATKVHRTMVAKLLIDEEVDAAGFKACTALPDTSFAKGTKSSLVELWETITLPRKEILKMALHSMVPASNTYLTFGGVCHSIGMKVLPNKRGDVRTTAEEQMAIGTIVLDRLQLGGVITFGDKRVSSAEGTASTTTVEIDWKSLFGDKVHKAIQAIWSGTSIAPSALPQGPITSRARVGYQTDALRRPVSKSNLKISAITRHALEHRGAVALSIFTFDDNDGMFNDTISKYLKLQDKRILEAQHRMNIEASLDETIDLKVLTAFNRKAFLAQLVRLRLLNRYFVLAVTDDRTRTYDASSFGFQADKFIRHMIRFADGRVATTASIAETKSYIKHLKKEIPALSKGSVKDQIECLGLEVKLLQCEKDLRDNTANTPLEYDGKNSGIQMYATAALKSLTVARYGGLDPEQQMDAYQELVDWLNATYNIDIKMQIIRNDGKRPVMVFIYGGGKTTIISTGGEGWKGLRQLLIDHKAPKIPTEKELYEAFTALMDQMLPGVQSTMKMALQNHSSRRGTKNIDGIVRYQWTSLVGNTCQILMEQHKVKVRLEIPLTNCRTASGYNRTVTHYVTILNPNVKTQALAPLPIHSVDSSILVIVLAYFRELGLDIGTVHDGFLVRATDVATLFDAYKRALVTSNDSNIYAEMMADLNPAIKSQEEWDLQVINNIAVLKNFANHEGFEALTTKQIMASTPLSM